MRQIMKLTLILLVAGLFLGFKTPTFAPKLYPQIDNYFKSISLPGASNENKTALETLKGNLDFSRIDNLDYNVVFTSDDPVKSQAAQIILHTWVVAKRLKRVNVFSCNTTTDLSPQLIDILQKIGYKIQLKRDTNLYEIRFADNAEPIIIKGASCEDRSIPSENKSLVTLCNDCNTSDVSVSKFNLIYKISGVESFVRSLATDIYYAMPKK